MDPVSNAYWSLRTLCYTDYAPALTGQGTTAAAPYTSLRAKRAVVAISVIVIAPISAFSAGSAVGFAVQNQIAKKEEERMNIEIEKVTARVNILYGNLEPQTFFNTLSGRDKWLACEAVNKVFSS